ncbi:MAG: flagellar protein export ATPase FliI [Betaproteobacteria bacterium]|nr:flagellar protein export ATPase FliI [Betaproteobacteria bacterium]
MLERTQRLFDDYAEAVRRAPGPVCAGRLTRVAGLVLETSGLRVPVGSMCVVEVGQSERVEAEVVGFIGGRQFLMPTSEVNGLEPGARVYPVETAMAMPPQLGEPWFPRRRAIERMRQVGVGDALLGRVIDGHGRPLDNGPPLSNLQLVPLQGRPVNPLDRDPIDHTLDVGVRSINTLLTIGRGQRIGLFAGSGVGKSVTLGMMARYTDADVVVVGLIGERGREVKDFIENILGKEGRQRAVVVAAPADVSPLLRMHGASYAHTVAEYFRDQGRHVLLIMDSLTRYAQANREIALAIGEPPATRGYPPSVFARLPQLVERAGNGLGGRGSITAFYTVLAEGDDLQDPVADAARAILDGHITLSRALADSGHYPAIDIETSISRVMPDIVDTRELERARRFRALYTRYQRSRDLISIGAYVPGNDRTLDEAVRLFPVMEQFLVQGMHEPAALPDCRAALERLLP